MQLTDRTLATILAALRYWQQDLEANEDSPITDHFYNHTPLTPDEIDTLCEELNCGAGVPPAARSIIGKAIDLITTSIDGRMSDEPEIAKANEILCSLYQSLAPAEERSVNIHAALANYEPALEPTPWYRNHYKCECGTEWQDEHDCMCDDRCPTCNLSMQPHHSDDLTDGEI